MRHHILLRILHEIGGKHLYVELRNGTKFTDVDVMMIYNNDGAVLVGNVVVDEEDIVLVRNAEIFEG